MVKHQRIQILRPTRFYILKVSHRRRNRIFVAPCILYLVKTSRSSQSELRKGLHTLQHWGNVQPAGKCGEPKCSRRRPKGVRLFPEGRGMLQETTRYHSSRDAYSTDIRHDHPCPKHIDAFE